MDAEFDTKVRVCAFCCVASDCGEMRGDVGRFAMDTLRRDSHCTIGADKRSCVSNMVFFWERRIARSAFSMSFNLTTGSIFDDRYEIVGHLGEGGMGNVYRAREIGLGRTVALKFLQPSLVDDEESRKRFQREGRVLATLSHPNIATFYRFGIYGALPFIAMEFLQGESLHEVICREGHVSTDKLLPIAIQTCRAMAHAHRMQIIHRDLKPGNIMLVRDADTAAELVRIVDFGLARVLPDGVRESQRLTQTGELVGSIYYLSPEQCTGGSVDNRSDIYALGCLLYEALAGAPPLVADNPIGLLHLHVNVEPVPITKVMPSIEHGAEWDIVLARAMAKNPDVRYQNMDEMAHDLVLIQEGKGAELRSSCASGRRGRLRLSAWVLIFGMCVVVCISLLMFVLTRTNRAVDHSFSHLTTTNSHSIHIGASTIELYPINRSSMSYDARIALLTGWLKKFEAADLLPSAYAHFWLAVELSGAADGVYFYVPGHPKRPYQINVESKIISAEAAQHRKIALRGFRLFEKVHLAGEPLSYLKYHELCLLVLDASANQRLKIYRDLLHEFGSKIMPTLSDSIRRGLAEIYELAGDFSAAEGQLVAIADCDEPLSRVALARCCYAQGKTEDAHKVLDTLFKRVLSGELEDCKHFIIAELLAQKMPEKALRIINMCPHEPRTPIDRRDTVYINDHCLLAALAAHAVGEDHRANLYLKKIDLSTSQERRAILPSVVSLAMVMKQAPYSHFAEAEKSGMIETDEIEWMLPVARSIHNRGECERLVRRSMDLLERDLYYATNSRTEHIVETSALLRKLDLNTEAENFLSKFSAVADLKSNPESFLLLQNEHGKILFAMNNLKMSMEIFDNVRAVARSRLGLVTDEALVTAAIERGRIFRAEQKYQRSCGSFYEVEGIVLHSCDLTAALKASYFFEFARSLHLKKNFEKERNMLKLVDIVYPSVLRGVISAPLRRELHQ